VRGGKPRVDTPTSNAARHGELRQIRPHNRAAKKNNLQRQRSCVPPYGERTGEGESVNQKNITHKKPDKNKPGKSKLAKTEEIDKGGRHNGGIRGGVTKKRRGKSTPPTFTWKGEQQDKQRKWGKKGKIGLRQKKKRRRYQTNSAQG